MRMRPSFAVRDLLRVSVDGQRPDCRRRGPGRRRGQHRRQGGQEAH